MYLEIDFVDFFKDLGFDFQKTESEKFPIEKNEELTEKIQKEVFYYKNASNLTTSFYIITTTILLNEKEISDIRKIIWNKNDADVLFLYAEDTMKMLYAKSPPAVSNKDSEIAEFSTTEKDDKKLEKIRRWQFDSGTFWLNYSNFLRKAKNYNKIDTDLVNTLLDLKNELNNKLTSLISDDRERNETVQALIDRTLYIKYLEENHIINSFFYEHYFYDDSLDYKTLLNTGNEQHINELFKIIHEIFSNQLFDKPNISPQYLTPEICNLIAQSFNRSSDGQLRLFDFQFDVLPIEFISYIYEVFLTNEQKRNGIYYTPKKLAQLIVDEVLKEDEIGSILDPSCGSGMFLITGYQRLLGIEQKKGNEPTNNIDKIKFRTKLLKENIFGIEKQPIAHRLALFSLSLQIFKDILPTEIRDFIAQELDKKGKIQLFSEEYNFYDNILCQNTLDVDNSHFKGIEFYYIIGNPPFFEIKDTNEEISFLNNYDVHLENEKTAKVKEIVGTHQISQCFFLKLKDWANENTRFGFVSNSSNFYNDNSIDFQKYFYTHYGIEKIYELSRVKKILFEKAKESVVALIFNNTFTDNTIEYYPVNMGLFSEKPFELLIIEEDKAIEVRQIELQSRKVRLRDYLIGNEFDNRIIKQLNNLSQLKEYIYSKNDIFFLHRGIEFVGFEEINKEFGINQNEWNSFSKQQKNEYYEKFKNQYTSKQQTDRFNIPFIKPASIEKFKVYTPYCYLGNISMFHRPRLKELYEGKRIVWSRIGKTLKAVYLKKFVYFDFDLYVLKLKNEDLYYLIVAILNSDLINFYVNIHLKKRIDGSFPKIGMDDVKNLPIPKELDEDLVYQIDKISKDLTEGKFEYSEKEKELNELIFDLYDLSYTEKQRIRDYFIKKKPTNKNDLKRYEETLIDSMQMFFKNPIQVDTYSEFNLIVAKVILNKQYLEDNPNAKNTLLYTLNEIFEQNATKNYLMGQEKIFGEYCVYIIKKDINTNWTETKAFEDGQDILKRLIDFKNGNRKGIC